MNVYELEASKTEGGKTQLKILGKWFTVLSVEEPTDKFLEDLLKAKEVKNDD
jgi:hypothetical protein